MGFENINLWYAKDKNNNIITIDKLNNSNKHEKYNCPICMSEVIPKLGSSVSHHFAHRDSSKCTNESVIHYWIKNKLLEKGDSFTVSLTKNEERNYICKDIYIEKEYKTKFGVYKPDVTVITEDNYIIFFEVAYTNKKRIDEYREKWESLNNMVIEVSTKELINGNETKKFKCIYDNYKIYNFIFKEGKDTSEFRNYKRNIFKTEEIEKAKERLNKIDWFWCECIKRKQGKIEDDDFFKVIDSLDIKDRMYVVDKVLKSSCTDVRWLYLYYKQKQIKEIIENFIKEETESVGNNSILFKTNKFDFVLEEEKVYREMFNKGFIIPYVEIRYEMKNLIKIYSDYFDVNEILSFVRNYIFYKTDNLKIKENYINNILKDTIENYSIEIKIDTIHYDSARINIKYYENIISSFNIKDFKNDDVMKMVTYNIYKNKKEFNITGMEKDIDNILKNNKKVVCGLNKINNGRPYLYVNNYREDERIIYLRIDNFMSLKEEYLFLIKGNEVRDKNGIYVFNTVKELENIIKELLPQKIREIRNR